MTPLSRKKSSSAGAGAELRLSELPDDILLHILSFLPSAAAARCSFPPHGATSASLPSASTSPGTSPGPLQPPPPRHKLPFRRLPSPLLPPFASHPIPPFHFYRPIYFYQEYVADAAAVALHSGATDIRIDLNLPSHGNAVRPWRRTSSCSGKFDRAGDVGANTGKMQILHLKNLYMTEELFHGVNFSSLRSLLLIHVYVHKDQRLQQTIDGCPLLQNLEMQLNLLPGNALRIALCPWLERLICCNIESLYVDAPQLKEFEYSSSCAEELIIVGGAQNLTWVGIYFSTCLGSLTLENVLRNFSNAKSLSLSIFDGMHLITSTKTPLVLAGVKHLEVKESDFEQEEFHKFLCFLNATPYLESLVLRAVSYKALDNEEGDYISCLRTLCLQNHPKKLRIELSELSEHLLRMVKLLLERCLVLEEVTVVVPKKYDRKLWRREVHNYLRNPNAKLLLTY